MKPTVKSTLYREKIARAMWNSRNVSDWADVTNTGLISIYHNLADAAIAALEPAPDHAEWNAAIEAAIGKARQVGFLSIEDLQALKKGQTND